jgi:hypothetical protein
VGTVALNFGAALPSRISFAGSPVGDCPTGAYRVQANILTIVVDWIGIKDSDAPCVGKAFVRPHAAVASKKLLNKREKNG